MLIGSVVFVHASRMYVYTRTVGNRQTDRYCRYLVSFPFYGAGLNK